MEEANGMKIKVGYGVGKGDDAFAAGMEATRQAVSGDNECPLSAVLVFASVRYDLGALLRGIRNVIGEAPVLGTTTAGEICNSPQQESVVVVTLVSPYLSIRVGVGEGVSRDWQQAVTQAVSTPELRPFFSPQDNAVWQELTRRGKTAFALLFSPGNTRHADSRGYEILEELKRLSEGRLPIFGGNSADDWHMETNYVFTGQQAYPDSVLLAVVETRLRFGIGLAHGFCPTPRRATVTRAHAHEVLELDGRPAADVYAQLLDTSPEALAGKHLTFTTGQPAGSPDPYGQYSINVASYFTRQGGVRFAQPVPEGSLLTIMEADQDSMITAGGEALRKALLRGGVTNPAVAFVFSCALRSRILGERTGEELAGMRAMVAGVPIVGFYSFGEQGLADDGVNRHNNEVVTVLVLGQELSHAAQVALENERLRKNMRESEEKYRQLVNNVHAGVVVHGPDTGIILTNKTAQRLLGLTEGQMSGRTAIDPAWRFTREDGIVLPPEEYPVSRVIATQTPLENLVAGIKRSDTEDIIWVLVNAFPLFDQKGDLQQVIVTFMDITKRKQAEETLRESEERYSSLFENNHSVMLLIDPETADIVDANPAACIFYGYSKAEITSKKITDINILTSEQVFQEMERAKLEQRKHFYFRHRLASGEVRDVEVYSGPIKVRGKGLLYSIIYDITKRVRAEEKIKASLKEKEILLREIYHRVKNNMQVISSLLRIQSRQLKNEQAIEMFKDNQDRITSMALVHEQLYQSKDLANVNFGAYIRKLVNSLSSSRETDAGKLILDIETEDVTLGVNTAIPCGLIINELVSNAFKHAFPGGREGIISITFRTADENRVELIIRDNGVGLPKDMDLRNADTLGLQLVTNLVEHQLLGKIELRRNEGTEFRIKFVDAKGREKI